MELVLYLYGPCSIVCVGWQFLDTEHVFCLLSRALALSDSFLIAFCEPSHHAAKTQHYDYDPFNAIAPRITLSKSLLSSFSTSPSLPLPFPFAHPIL